MIPSLRSARHRFMQAVEEEIRFDRNRLSCAKRIHPICDTRHPVVYLAENPSSVSLEVLVHLEMDDEHQPDSFHLLKVEVPDELNKEEIPLKSLRLGWRAKEAITPAIGYEWLFRSSCALMRVPFVITPDTYNWLLNPRHSDATSVAIVEIEKHLYDSRLLKR
jgi:RES domain-containing protein